jgi:hypothetical protein
MHGRQVLGVIQKQPRSLLMACCVASMVAGGLADYVTPDDLVATVFYLLPVALAAWCLSRSAGLAFALAGSVTYLLCQTLQARSILPAVLLLNTVLQSAVSVAGALLLSGLRTHLEGEERARHVAEEALGHVRQLSQFLPMCSSCKKIRDEPVGTWEPFEVYLLKHSDTQVSHGMCPDCIARLYPEHLARLMEKKALQPE